MKCRDCNTASIVFVRMRSGKAMPVDPHPDERGNIVALRDNGGRYLDGRYDTVFSGQLKTGEVRLMPHYATCSSPKHQPKRGTPRPLELGGNRQQRQRTFPLDPLF